MQTNLKPTKRFMIEPLLDCNVDCKFCYHKHKKAEWKKYTKPLQQIIEEIDKGKERDNDYMDITGGEPTIYPWIVDTVKYALTKNIKTCIITNGLAGPVITEKLLSAGIADFLISIHGLEKVHNYVVQTEKARKMQERFLNQIKGKVHIRFNCVITSWNQNEIDLIASWMSQWNPDIVNFINFNPHHGWKDDPLTEDIVADLRIVEPILNRAIEQLENNGIGINVRYYPMCRIAEKYRRCICNDLQVMFDPYEWDYNTLPKTDERFFEWGRVTSNNNEEKCQPCCECSLQNVCGGANKFWHAASSHVYGESLDKIEGENIEDFSYYRKENIAPLSVFY
ncbi:MAG: radical SAM protein [Candidatus Hodarchaeota archaeon]